MAATGTTTSETTSNPEPEVQELSTPEQLLEDELDTYAALTFWYGIGPTELVEIPMNILRAYVRALPRLLAEYQSMLILGGSYAYIPEKDQKEIQAGLQRASSKATSSPDGKVDIKSLGPRARQMLFAQMGITFEEAPASVDVEVLKGLPGVHVPGETD